MLWVGQHHIMRQLKIILPELHKNPSMGACILFRGPSGYGKTTMARSACHYLAGTNFGIFLGNEAQKWQFDRRVIFIDEVHLAKEFEILYPEMDKSLDWRNNPECHVFIFATNMDGNLPEAFTNRCWEYIFSDYDMDELLLIARDSSDFKADDSSFAEIVEAGNHNPRIIKSLCARMSIYFAQNPSINSRDANFKEILSNIFDLEDGLDSLCRSYLEVLSDIGGRASLSIIKSLLHTDQGTITNKIEPILLRKKLINITSKGRILV